MNCTVGRRCGLDLPLLWLWCRLAATAPIQPLAWELPYATGAALKKKKKRKVANTTYSFKISIIGVLAVVQWVHDPACLCGGTRLIPGLGSLALLQLWHGLQRQLRFNLWHGNFRKKWGKYQLLEFPGSSVSQ